MTDVMPLPPVLGQTVRFFPSDLFCEKTRALKAVYLAICIGTVKGQPFPVLRVFNPYAMRIQDAKPKPRYRGPAIKARVGPVEFESDGVGHFEQSQTGDWTVWCDAEGTWGRWEVVQ